MNYRRGQGPFMPSLGLKELLALKENDPPCVCGKERYYSAAAAEAALSQVMARRMLQLGQISERAVYECQPAYLELGLEVWHLTSNDGWASNDEVKELRAKKEQGR